MDQTEPAFAQIHAGLGKDVAVDRVTRRGLDHENRGGVHRTGVDRFFEHEDDGVVNVEIRAAVFRDGFDDVGRGAAANDAFGFLNTAVEAQAHPDQQHRKA